MSIERWVKHAKLSTLHTGIQIHVQSIFVTWNCHIDNQIGSHLHSFFISKVFKVFYKFRWLFEFAVFISWIWFFFWCLAIWEFFMLYLLRRTSFWPPSMVYNSIILHTLQITIFHIYTAASHTSHLSMTCSYSPADSMV